MGWELRGPKSRLCAAVVAALFPLRWRRMLLKTALGYEIDGSAHIGRSVVVVDKLVMAPRTRIGSLCLLKGCERIELEPGSEIGSLNWVNAVARSDRHFQGEERTLTLALRVGAAITFGHIIDCCDHVEIGAFSTVAGSGSHILTHTVHIGQGRQVCAPVRIGERVFVGHRTVLLPGTTIANNSVVAAGAVVAEPLREEFTLYGGVPAKPIRRLDPSSGYFTRTEPHVF